MEQDETDRSNEYADMHAAPSYEKKGSSLKIEQVIEHTESASGANQDVVYVTVAGVAQTPSDDLRRNEVEGNTAISDNSGSTTMAHFVQSMMLPSRIMMSALRVPFKVAFKGKRRPTWTTEMEMAVSAFRSACRNAPRDLSLLRAWLDVEIFPSLLLPSSVKMHETSLLGMRIEWIYPKSLSSPDDRFSNKLVVEWSKIAPVVLYLHGGGHALCGTNTHRAMVAQFAAEGLILCAPNYRRPPEVTIVDAVEDCLSTYRYLVDIMGVPPSRISVMGDSAGGALTVLLLCRIRDLEGNGQSSRLLPPSCGVLLSPWVELEDERIVTEAEKGNIMPDHDYLPRDALVMISRLVVGKLSPKDPRINPMSANVGNLPKMLIHIGELELLFDQVTRFYEKVRDEGGEVRMKIWIDGVHVPHVFTAVSEEARIAVNDAANFIKQNTLESSN
jgi:acetyl esterase/lipase